MYGTKIISYFEGTVYTGTLRLFEISELYTNMEGDKETPKKQYFEIASGWNKKQKPHKIY